MIIIERLQKRQKPAKGFFEMFKKDFRKVEKIKIVFRKKGMY